jgi:hypothetical protein
MKTEYKTKFTFTENNAWEKSEEEREEKRSD